MQSKNYDNNEDISVVLKRHSFFLLLLFVLARSLRGTCFYSWMVHVCSNGKRPIPKAKLLFQLKMVVIN